jgi:hypothetical protein
MQYVKTCECVHLPGHGTCSRPVRADNPVPVPLHAPAAPPLLDRLWGPQCETAAQLLRIPLTGTAGSRPTFAFTPVCVFPRHFPRSPAFPCPRTGSVQLTVCCCIVLPQLWFPSCIPPRIDNIQQLDFARMLPVSHICSSVDATRPLALAATISLCQTFPSQCQCIQQAPRHQSQLFLLT